VGSGVPLLQMLNITAEAVNNVLIPEAIHAASEKVKGGKALSDSLMGNPYFPDLCQT
jgi:type II secretory pathway component PulF